MNKIQLFTGLIAVFTLFAGSAMATPGRSICSNCHSLGSSIDVSAASMGCSGDQETFEITVSSSGNANEGWAVFDGNSNLSNGYGSNGTVFLSNGTTYEVWGVSMDGGGMGGSNKTSITVDCSVPACSDNDRDGYFAESGCGTLVDCDDSDPEINPGAPEDCTDGIDNDCDGQVDDQDPNAVGCPLPCTDADGDGYSAEGGNCGPVDCNDSSNGINPAASEICDNGFDDNCDGLIDVFDPDCGACIPTASKEKGKKCSDGIDNDCDGLADIDDPDCKLRGRSNGIPEICDDGIDNDGDRKIDCSDKKDCGKDPVCR